MADISETLKSMDVRNQVLLERLKQGEHEKFTPFLKKLERDVRIRLSDEGATIDNKKRLNILLSDVKSIQRSIYDDYLKQLTLDLSDIGLNQAELEALSYERVVVKFESTIPSAAQVSVALRVNPLQVEGYTGNPLLEPFLRDWSASRIQQANTVIQQGFYRGATISDMTSELRGTKANKFNDGTWAKVNRSNRTIVRTAIQHVSTQARHETMNQNSDLVKGYEWVATLDSRTSQICQSLDGRRFKLGFGPTPPLHFNERSTTTPVFSSAFDFLDKGATRASKSDKGGAQVGAKETYYSWLKKQNKAFQIDAIGPTRTKLMREGGLTADQFAKMQVNKNFEPLTLAEMKKKRPDVFAKAEVD